MKHRVEYIHPYFEVPISIELEPQEVKRRLRGLDKRDVKVVRVVFSEELKGGVFNGTPNAAFNALINKETRDGKP